MKEEGEKGESGKRPPFLCLKKKKRVRGFFPFLSQFKSDLPGTHALTYRHHTHSWQWVCHSERLSPFFFFFVVQFKPADGDAAVPQHQTNKLAPVHLERKKIRRFLFAWARFFYDPLMALLSDYDRYEQCVETQGNSSLCPTSFHRTRSGRQSVLCTTPTPVVIAQTKENEIHTPFCSKSEGRADSADIKRGRDCIDSYNPNVPH